MKLTHKNYVERIIAAHRTNQDQKLYQYHGNKFVVKKNVFDPFIAPSGAASLALAAMPFFKEGLRVLDVGCGAGIQATLLGLNGCDVTAIDISRSAVENARENAKIAPQVHVIHSSIQDFKEGVFDYVIADLPFCDSEPVDELESAFYDAELLAIKSLVSRADDFLAINGSIFIFTSSLDRIYLDKICHKHNLKAFTFLSVDSQGVDIDVAQVVRGSQKGVW